MSESSTESTATESTEKASTEAASTETESQTDWQAEAEKYKALSRKNEERAKSNAEKAKGYDDLKATQMTEQEKAVEAARVEARQAALTEAAPRLVGAEFRAALAGRRTAEQVADLIEDLDLSKYLTESGEVDTERVTKKAELLAPASEERKTAPSFGGGARKTADKPEATPGIGRLRSAYADTAK